MDGCKDQTLPCHSCTQPINENSCCATCVNPFSALNEISRCRRSALENGKYCLQHQQQYLESYQKYKSLSNEVLKYPIMMLDYKLDLKVIDTQEFYKSTLKGLIPKLREVIDLRKFHTANFFSFCPDPGGEKHNKIVTRFEVLYKLLYKYYDKWRTITMEQRNKDLKPPQAVASAEFPYTRLTQSEQAELRRKQEEERLRKARERQQILNQYRQKKLAEKNKQLQKDEKQKQIIGEYLREPIDLKQFESYKVLSPCYNTLLYLNQEKIIAVNISHKLYNAMIKLIELCTKIFTEEFYLKVTVEKSLSIFASAIDIIYNENLNFMIEGDFIDFELTMKIVGKITDPTSVIIKLTETSETVNQLVLHYLMYSSLKLLLLSSPISLEIPHEGKEWMSSFDLKVKFLIRKYKAQSFRNKSVLQKFKDRGESLLDQNVHIQDLDYFIKRAEDFGRNYVKNYSMKDESVNRLIEDKKLTEIVVLILNKIKQTGINLENTIREALLYKKFYLDGIKEQVTQLDLLPNFRQYCYIAGIIDYFYLKLHYFDVNLLILRYLLSTVDHLSDEIGASQG